MIRGLAWLGLVEDCFLVQRNWFRHSRSNKGHLGGSFPEGLLLVTFLLAMTKYWANTP